jgi:hypothetical protein
MIKFLDVLSQHEAKSTTCDILKREAPFSDGNTVRLQLVYPNVPNLPLLGLPFLCSPTVQTLRKF